MSPRIHLALLAVAALVAGCAPPGSATGGEPAGEAPPSPDISLAAGDLAASCGTVEFPDLPVDPSVFPPFGDVHEQIDLAAIHGEHELFEVHDWRIAAEAGDTLVLFGQPQDPNRSEPGYAYAMLERDGERWVPQAWGGCQITVQAEGWGNARFVLEPEREPAPSSTRLAVRAWEVECASGQPPGDRDVRPVVLAANDHAVSVVILVEPVREGAECPSNPSFPVEIVLERPLGDRTVLDASVDPALERPWPPTESSLTSLGHEE